MTERRAACPDTSGPSSTFLRLYLLAERVTPVRAISRTPLQLRTRILISPSLQKWICLAFVADRCRWTVAGEHGHIVVKRK